MTFDKLFLILVAAALTGCGGGTSSSSKGIEIDLDSDSVAAEDVGEPVSITEKDYHVLTPFTSKMGSGSQMDIEKVLFNCSKTLIPISQIS